MARQIKVCDMKLLKKCNKKLIVLGATAVFALSMLVLCINSYQLGSDLGAAAGAAVGTAIGTKTGLNEGIDAGRKDGLSAEETEVILAGKMEAAGKLQVLASGVTLEDAQDIGKAYKSIEIVKGDVVFTVDLQNAEVTVTEKKATILIETPQVQFYLDESESEKIMEVQKFSLITNAEDGVTAFLNSRAQINEKIEEYIQGYDDLMETAKKCAVEQTRNLADAACGGTKEIVVGFKGE